MLAGCAIIKDNSILLLKRKSKDWYELPGGKIDPGETPEQTAIREIKEELCCDVKIIRKLGEKEFTENYKMKYHWFLAEIVNGEPKLGEEIFDHFAYIPLDKLNTIKLSPNMENFERHNFRL